MSAIVGTGLAVGGEAGVGTGKPVRRVLAWAGSLAVALLVGYGFVLAVGG